MRHEARDQRQRDGDIAAEHVAERKVGHRAMLLASERRVMGNDVGSRGKVLPMRDKRTLGMPSGSGRIDDEGGIARGKFKHLPLEPFERALLGIGNKLIEASEFLMPIM